MDTKNPKFQAGDKVEWRRWGNNQLARGTVVRQDVRFLCVKLDGSEEEAWPRPQDVRKVEP